VSSQPTAPRVQEIALERIQAGGNVRELNAEHVSEGAVCQAELRRLPRTSPGHPALPARDARIPQA
jgi:hypothetical protein